MSNTRWGTTSGGGWFVNDLLYSPGFQASMEEPDRDRSLKLVAQFYNYMVAATYNMDYFQMEAGINTGEYTRLSADDWVLLLKGYSCNENDPPSCSSWRDMVRAFHLDYGSAILPVQNLNWSSVISVAQTFNQYKIQTYEQAIDVLQYGYWNPCIPGAFHF